MLMHKTIRIKYVPLNGLGLFVRVNVYEIILDFNALFLAECTRFQPVSNPSVLCETRPLDRLPMLKQFYFTCVTIKTYDIIPAEAVNTKLNAITN